MLFEKDGRIFISMPGVPYEMKSLMKDKVLPLLKEKFQSSHIGHRTLLTAGIGESFLAEMIKDFEAALPDFIKLAYLPNYGMVRLRLTATGKQSIVENELDKQFNQLKQLVKDYLVIDEDITLQVLIGRMLKDKHKTVATAESCTGGYIAHLITSVPGSSNYFKGSVVSYDNSIKKNILKVKDETLQTVGAVSEETVREMLRGVLNIMQTDYAIAVSGIMGPDGGTPDKPVGTVWISVSNKHQAVAKRFQFGNKRAQNI